MVTTPNRRNVDSGAAVRRGKILRRKVLTGVLALVVISAIALVAAGRFHKSETDSSGMTTAKVERADIEQVVSATGSITAQTGAQVKIGSQITGRIKRLLADVGSNVKAGQVIAELDLPDIQAQYEQAVANLESTKVRLAEQLSGVDLQTTNTSSDIARAKANVDSAQASYDQSEKNAKLQVSTAEAAVKQAEASARNAQTLLSRNRQLVAKGYISDQELDNSQTQSDVAAAQLDSAQQNLELTRTKSTTDVQTALNALQNARAAQAAARAGSANNVIKRHQVAEARVAVSAARAQVAYWRAQYDKTVIRTPISGTVLALDVQQGETIAAGLSAPTLIRVTDLKKLQVEALVDESDIGSVRVGQRATVTVDAYPNREFKARVVKVASGATMQQNVVTYDTTLALDSFGGLLKPDMTATVRIIVGEHRRVLTVPIEAVKSAVKGQMVYVLKGDKVISQPIVTGVSNDAVTEAIKGLREGETVVTAGYDTQSQFGGPRMTPFGPGAGGSRSRSGAGGPPGP